VAPATIVTGDRDPLREDGRRYAARLRRAGVEVTELRHEAPSLTPPAQVLRDLAGALRRSLEPPQRRDTP
jgi:acetyl esterase/lipase